MIFHHDIFEYQRSMKLLSAPYFDIYNNVFKNTDIRPCNDITNYIKNQIGSVEELMFEDNDCTE